MDRSPSFTFVISVPGLSERLLGEKDLKLTHREDLTHTMADVAKRHCAARVHHSAELRTIEGDNLFDTLTTYRAVAERLASLMFCSLRKSQAV